MQLSIKVVYFTNSHFLVIGRTYNHARVNMAVQFIRVGLFCKSLDNIALIREH